MSNASADVPMKKTVSTNSASMTSVSAARVAIAAIAAALLLLASLHGLSPEFDPAWRMVSEYATGQFGWVLSLMFAAGAISNWALAIAVWPHAEARATKIGLGFLIAAGVGGAMGALFDINHPLHDLAGAIGILSLPAAAMLISVSLSRTPAWSASKKLLLWTANLTWVSIIILAATFVIMIATFTQFGGGTPTEVPTTLPPGVIGLVGWANRLLIAAYWAWAVTVAWTAIKLRG